MFYNDPFMPLIFLALGFSFWAQWKVKNSFTQYSQVKSSTGLTAAEVAREILDKNGLQTVAIERTAGELTDNYDPRTKVLNLSENVFDSNSLAAYGIAAHEAGHAIQHAKEYSPLMFRQNFFPAASLGSNLAIPLFFLGFFLSLPLLVDLGIILFSFAVVFSIITLPVEYDASNRALLALEQTKLVTIAELPAAKSVLSAAAWTYVAAATMAILQLARLLLLRNSRED